MAKKILINATFPEEIRVAIVQEGELVDFDIQSQEHFRTKSNIYKGVVTRLEPGLEAVFVNYGEERNGFLPLKEIIPEYLNHSVNSRLDLEQLISSGKEVIVQVDKEARKDKGAALTTRLSIAGRFMVMMRDAPKKIYMSRRARGDDKEKTIKRAEKLNVPDGCGIIIRTAGVGRSKEDLRWDLNYLTYLWEKITEEAEKASAPFLILQESDVITRTLRDNMEDDTLQVVVDTQEGYDMAKAIISHAVPDADERLELYDQIMPLFTHYGIENQVQSAFQHIIRLPSGGQLVFDRTEAMFIIDVNSSRSNKGADIEDTALTNNLEAVPEIGRQMKIRDIGGLIVVDFIDMMNLRNKRMVENAFHTIIQKDKARLRMSKISNFGMMEISRQRLRSSLDEFYLRKCPQCHGIGTVRTNTTLALQLKRHIWDTIQNPLTKKMDVRLPEEIHKIFLADDEKKLSAKLSEKQKEQLSLVADSTIHIPHFYIKTEDTNGQETVMTSFDGISTEPNIYAQPKHVRKRSPLLKTSDIFQNIKPRHVSIWERCKRILLALLTPRPSRSAPPTRQVRRRPRQSYTHKSRRTSSGGRAYQHHKRPSRGRNQIKR